MQAVLTRNPRVAKHILWPGLEMSPLLLVLATARVNLAPSELGTLRLEYDLPLRQPELALTNMALQTGQLQWRQAIPAPTPSLWNDGIESAERINELLLRRQREEWRRNQGL